METQAFCQQVKQFAKQFKTFDEFSSKVKKNFPDYRLIVKERDMKRLISVASVEANHV